MTNIIENINLVRKIAWSYARRTRSWEFEDLFSEACVAYLEGELDYAKNDSGASKTTYLWKCMNTHLLNLVLTTDSKYSRRESTVDMDYVDIASSDDPAAEVIAAERWSMFEESLSPVSKDICDIVLHDKTTYLPIDTPKLCRGTIRNELRARGWSWSAIWNGYRELHQALAQA
ncbi:MAG: hypothetical protein WC992_06970 [Acholeplasmataceae bacterium]